MSPLWSHFRPIQGAGPEMRRSRRRTSSLAGLASQRERKEEEDRVRRIKDALAQRPPDLDNLRLEALRGLHSDELRRRAWPALLGVDDDAPLPWEEEEEEVNRKGNGNAGEDEHEKEGGRWANPYSEQIGKDVPRSLHHFSSMRTCRRHGVRVLQASLKRSLNCLFARHRDLHYVQGFNDICSVFLLVCGERLGYRLSERLAVLHVRDSLRPSLETVAETLGMVFPLVEQVDAEVFAFLERAQVQSFFTLSWVLTWFAHDIDDMDALKRLFDFLLASHPLMPVYLAVALILQLREGLLRLECEYAEVHQYFQNLPPSLDVRALVRSAARLCDDYPPGMLCEKVGSDLPSDSPMHAASADELVRGAGATASASAAAAAKRRQRWRRALVPAAAVALGAALVAWSQMAAAVAGGGL